ncbi:hypothetical protein ACFWAT_00970 [Streptomyces syringium]|uniref:hypothetical protein n=1 Tax=Streptomyces syringium TaxID=76729 RepID=UPI00364FF963
MITRLLSRTRIVVAAALLGAATVTPAARATESSTVLVACAGSVAATYAPGLTYAPQPTAIRSHAVAKCPVSVGSTLTSATFGGSSTGTLSCLAGSASGTLTLHWDNGKSSTASITSIASLRPNGNMVTVSTGAITAGTFTGAAVVTEVTLLASSVSACLTPKGLTSASGPTTVTVTRLVKTSHAS